MALLSPHRSYPVSSPNCHFTLSSPDCHVPPPSTRQPTATLFMYDSTDSSCYSRFSWAAMSTVFSMLLTFSVLFAYHLIGQANINYLVKLLIVIFFFQDLWDLPIKSLPRLVKVLSMLLLASHQPRVPKSKNWKVQLGISLLRRCFIKTPQHCGLQFIDQLRVKISLEIRVLFSN